MAVSPLRCASALKRKNKELEEEVLDIFFGWNSNSLFNWNLEFQEI
jgi:hypothetical protein